MNALDGMKQMVKLLNELKVCRFTTCDKEDVELKKAFDGALIAVLGVIECIAQNCNKEWSKKK